MSRLLILQHIERERPGLFIKVARERGLKVCTFRLDRGDSLPDLRNDDLLLVLGGPMGIKDIGTSNYPWLTKEVALVKKALNKGIRMIGVCLGARLLAYAAGGRIKSLKDAESQQSLAEIGWFNVFPQSLESESKLTKLLSLPFPVLHWHKDRIILPNNAELIASSCRCNEQLFRIAPFAYGVQFHVEIDDDMVERWIKEDKEFISSALGRDGQSILKNQQKNFGSRTMGSRLEFINILFDLLS